MTLSHIARKALAASMSAILAGSLLGAPTLAVAEEDDAAVAAQADALPAKLDLRERGVVTPVKRQNPWSTCWSFGAIAAAETSILSESGETYAETGIDLSERHLIQFAMTPVTEAQSASQYGEGLYQLGNEKNSNAAFRAAKPIVSSTLFSTGAGPLRESDYPYQNNEGMTEWEYMIKRPDDWKRHVKQEVEAANGKSLAQIIYDHRFDDNYPQSEIVYLQNSYLSYLKTVRDTDNYTEYLDWSLDPSARNQTIGYTLIDGNQLPQFAVRDSKGTWTGLNAHGVEATKRELQKGHAVMVGIHADSSTPSDKTKEGKYIELNNWAHYTYDNASANHSVTIVGWDDNYPKENFLSGTDGNGNSKRPPANGAWIVKNSWGSETEAVTNANGRPISKGSWGVKDSSGKSTGYFYVSYYDKSIENPETLRFGADLSSGDYFNAYQYDFLPATDGFYFVESGDRVSTANIYTSGTDEDEVLTSIGVRTYAENTTVENEVYVLPAGVNNPEKGEKVASFKSTLEYGGYHRIALPNLVTLKPGTRFSIVSTAYVKKSDGALSYGLAANKADSEAYAQRMLQRGKQNWVYGKSVINKGESFIYWKDGWYDWRECIDNDLSISGLMKAQAEDDASSAVAAQAETAAADSAAPEPAAAAAEPASAVSEPAAAEAVATMPASPEGATSAAATPEVASAAAEPAEKEAEGTLAAQVETPEAGVAAEKPEVGQAGEANAAETGTATADATETNAAAPEAQVKAARPEENAAPSEAAPSEATPSEATPSEATPAEETSAVAETTAAEAAPQAEGSAEMTAQANDAGRHPAAIEKGLTVVDNFTLKAFTVPASQYSAAKVESTTNKSTVVPEGYSVKDTGTVAGETRDWPKDGLTDEDNYEDEDAAWEDPGMPGDKKDYYDDEWMGDDPSQTFEYPAPVVTNSRGGTFTSVSEEITYTVSQEVPTWASSLRTWVDLEPVLGFTTDSSGISVTVDGAPVEGVEVSIEGQKLTVTIADTTALLGKTIQFSYKAKVKDGADLTPYLNEAKNMASVPYQAHTMFDEEESFVAESAKEYVNFSMGAPKNPKSPKDSTASSTSASKLPNTGDPLSAAAVVTIAFAGAGAALEGLRRRKRG